MSKLGQIKAMRKSMDIQQFLDAAYKILQNPIAMFDTNYSLIMYTEVVTDDPIWNELISTGTFCMETQKFFASEYFTYDVTNADKLVVLKSEELKYDRVLANVFNRDRIKVANLVTVACNTSFSADDLIAFNALADKITGKIREDAFYTAYGRSYHDSLIVKILDGEIKDTRIYSPHVQILYDGFESYLYLAVVKADRDGGRRDDLLHLKDLLMERYKSFKFAIYSDYIVMIMSSKQSSFNGNRVLGVYHNFFEKNKIFAGVSNSFENLYELRFYYDEAAAALKSGIESNRGHLFY